MYQVGAYTQSTGNIPIWHYNITEALEWARANKNAYPEIVIYKATSGTDLVKHGRYIFGQYERSEVTA